MRNLIICLFVFGRLAAQIPNSGFENWTYYSPYFYDPDNWCTYNGSTTGPGIYTTTKGTPGFTGNSFLVLETKTFTPSGFLRGKAISGQYMPGGSIKGIPLSTRPSFLNGAWKYSNPTANPGEVSVYLSKWNTSTNKRDTICYYKTFVSGTVTAWANFSIDFSSGYKSNVNPDSCIISLFSSSNQIGAYLHIDDLAFSGNVTLIKKEFQNSVFSVFPNPTSDYLNFIFNERLEDLKIIITDKFGKELIITSESKIYVGDLANDSYFITVINKDRVLRKVFIKAD